MSRHSRYVLDNSDRYTPDYMLHSAYNRETKKFELVEYNNPTGNKMYHRLGDIEFVRQVDMLRDMGKSWEEIDVMLEIARGRARRLYKRVCASYGIKDVHHYRHCLSY